MIDSAPHCGRCGKELPTTHIHYRSNGEPFVNLDCASAGRAYEPDACDGDDLCDDCLADVFAEYEETE